MPKFTDSINLLVIPTDACNMDCIYCFHKPHFERKRVMSREVLEKTIDLACSEYRRVQFVWHGGEPLLAGIDFYKDALSLQAVYPDCLIRNTMQSNLTLISEDTARFLFDNHFGVGSSFDGAVNDTTRENTQRIIDKYRLCREMGLNIGFIMVLSRFTVDHLIESYEIFKRLKSNFSINDYISLSDEDSDKGFYIPSDLEISKMCELFDYWVNDSDCTIHINTFDEYLKFIAGKRTSKCRFHSCLGHWMCIRPDGQIMPCNRYFPEEYGFGNIMDLSRISDAFSSDGFRSLLKKAVERKSSCKSCTLYGLCNGGCNNVAYAGGNISQPNRTRCAVMIPVFKHIETWCKNTPVEEIRNPVIRKMLL